MAGGKRIKIYLPGQVTKNKITYQFMDGTTVDLDNIEKIVVPSKKNQQRIAINRATLKPMILASEQHVKWHKNQFKVFKDAVDKLHLEGISLPLNRVKVKVLFYFPESIPRDLHSKFETIADIMTDAGLILDDMFQVLKPIYLDGWVNRAKPRTEIYLTVIPPTSKEYTWDITPAGYDQKKKDRRNLMERIRADKKRRVKADTAA